MSGLFTIDPGAGFLDSVAGAWLEACGHDPIACGDGLILLPTRRGVRALTDAFLRVSGRPALLLPRIDAIGAPDEAPMAMAGAAEQPDAIGRIARQAALARLVLAHAEATTPAGVPTLGNTSSVPTLGNTSSVPTLGNTSSVPTLGNAFALASSLADLIDEAARWDIDLARALPSLAPDALALHWQITLDFLAIVTERWPSALAATGLADPAARQSSLLASQAAAWSDRAPAHPVWLAGIIAATPAELALARAVARLPAGRLILPGLDLGLDEASWDTLGDFHPQAGLRRMLACLGATRGDVSTLGGSIPGRVALLRRAMLPAQAVAATWRQPVPLDAPPPEPGLTLIAAADEQVEALAIAFALRDAIETPGRTAALVTSDRALAQRVAAELGRFGILADDSAGERLADTPHAVFLRLIATTLADGLPPANLLALLKHPFATIGLTQAACRREARRLELLCLRGPRPLPGITGLRRAAAGARRINETDRRAVEIFLDRLAAATAPLDDAVSRDRIRPVDLVAALLATAERVAEADRLWSGEEGEALSAHMAELLEALAPLPPQPPSCLPGLLDASLAGVSVHGRRALRGRDDAEIHPRLSIWGLLEARGQTADLIVLGGLVDGVWPAPADPGPWMGRQMRAAVGLPAPEAAIGASAHDFTMLACAAPRIILSYASRRDRAPAVPSRWIARLEACLAGAGQSLPPDPAVAWAASLDQPDTPRPARPPTPRPPVSHRPRQLSVTEIETWLRDPYAIYARHILRLPPLAPIEEEADRALFGNLVHDALAHAYRHDTVDADGLQSCFEAAIERFAVRRGVAAWWRPRLRRIAEWIAAAEAARRATGAPSHLATEIAGRWTLDGPAGPFTLTGRADRIECHEGLAILDYKTGTLPSRRSMQAGWSPQLPLEATMATLGGFGDAFRDRPVAELAHWKLSGGPTPGETQSLRAGQKLDDLLADAWHGLEARIEAFDDPATAYLAQPFPAEAPAHAQYGVLARVAEWRIAEDEE